MLPPNCVRQAAVLLATVPAILAVTAHADETADGPPANLEPAVVVIGERIQLDTIPPARFSTVACSRNRVFTINEAMRGARGARRKAWPAAQYRYPPEPHALSTCCLEDGIPPPTRPTVTTRATTTRLSTLRAHEVLKGLVRSCSPHTVGGVINYITPAPSDTSARLMRPLATRLSRGPWEYGT
jgi:hypothetical protein